nr:RNA-directed DNA polymerase, eukaryota, reverse transcriptase zinc-binding domain protein [Tanacetum cinerariifolium]
MPITVCKKLESIRACFFWESDGSTKKLHWIAWNSVTISKRNGGLGIRSLFSLNHALIQKWRWGFVNHSQSLWVRLITAIHSGVENVTTFFRYISSQSVWGRIVGSINTMHEKGFIPLSTLSRRVNNGADTKFKSIQQISTEIQQSKPLTKREVLNLVEEISEQPNQEAHHRMSLANLKATTEYQEAIQATEDIEPPPVGFAKTTDYKGGLTNQVTAVIKQNNTLLYLASKQSQKLIELEKKFDRLKQNVHTIIEKEIQPADLEDSISSLAKRLDNFSISGKLLVKRTDEKIHAFEDPNKIFKEQFEKESKK